MFKAVTTRINKDKRKKVGILASPMIRKAGLYQRALSKKGIKVIYPNKKDEIKVEAMIRAVIAGTNNSNLKKIILKLCKNFLTKKQKQLFWAVQNCHWLLIMKQ